VPRLRAVTALALLAAATLAGCGGESDKDKAAEKQLRASGAPTPVCADQVTDPATVPSAFPADFPLPDGAVVYGAERRSGGRTIVYAVVDRDVKAVLQQLQDGMKGAGFTLTEGEVEERDAESNWTGNGYTGRWAIREVAGCPEQTSVTVLAAKG
jgi:uncharacterized lipoprotein